MKKLIGIIIGIILTSTVVYATNVIDAEHINYDENTTVKSKIDNLYSRINKVFTASDVTYSSNQGNGEATKTTSITLNKGKYLVFSNTGLAWPVSSNSNITDTASTTNNVSCSNCDISRIYGWLNEPKSSTTYSTNFTYYSSLSVKNMIYYVEITADNTTVTAEAVTSYGTPSKLAQAVAIAAVKLY